MKKKSTSQFAFFHLRFFLASFFYLTAVLMALFGMGAFAQGKASKNASTANQASPGTQTPDVVRMVGPVRLDQDLRSLPYIPSAERSETRRLTRYPLLETGALPTTETWSPWLRSLLTFSADTNDAAAPVHI
jgi:hypothetical protein